MTSISHGVDEKPERRRWNISLAPREMWAAIAIGIMWIAVAVCSIWGPDFASTSGGSSTTIPSGILLAFFAYLGTRVVARYGLGAAEDAAKSPDG